MGKKVRGAAKFFLHPGKLSVFIDPRRTRTCLWPIVVMQRRHASFLAEPVSWTGPEREVDMVAIRPRAAAPWPDAAPRLIRVARGSCGRGPSDPSSSEN